MCVSACVHASMSVCAVGLAIKLVDLGEQNQPVLLHVV
jgi:hypothetical protein